MKKSLVFNGSIGEVLRTKLFVIVVLSMASLLSVDIKLSSAGEPSLEEKEACRAHSVASGKLIYINRLNGVSEKEALDGVTNAPARAKAERDAELAEKLDAINREARGMQVTSTSKRSVRPTSYGRADIERARDDIKSAEGDKKQALELKKNTVGETRMQEIADENIANADKKIAESEEIIVKANENIAAYKIESARESEERKQELSRRLEAANADALSRDEDAKKLENPILDKFSISLIQKIYSLKNPASAAQLQKMGYEECYKAYASSHK